MPPYRNIDPNDFSDETMKKLSKPLPEATNKLWGCTGKSPQPLRRLIASCKPKEVG